MRFYFFNLIILCSYFNANSQCNQVFNLGPDVEICQGASTTLDAGATFPLYLWNDNSTNQTLVVSAPGEYYCSVSAVDESIDLVTNGDFESGNTDFTSNYTFNPVAVGNNPQGTYGIIDNPTSWFFPFSPCPDHTSGSGNMMVMDGAIANVTTTPFWCQTINVQANTDYSFSYWTQNVTSAPFANIRVEINGVVLGTELTPSIPCVWAQTDYVWSSAVNTSAQICLFNLETMSNGNDFAIDDISLNPFCVKIDTVQVSLAAQDSIFETEVLCDGDSFLVNGNFEKINGLYYENVTINTCNVVKEVELIFNPIPSADAGDDTTIITGSEVTLSAESDINNVTFQWFLDNILVSSDQSFTSKINETLNYTVTVEKDGCQSTDDITIQAVEVENDLLFPTAFTPNGDGLNDIFRLVKTEGVESIELSIYNRWGERIHLGINENHGWDGTYKKADQASDVYIFFVKIILTNDKVENNSGTFSLIR